MLGFERVGVHRRGELRCDRRRIILVLDIAGAYRRMKACPNRFFRELGAGVREALEERLGWRSA